MAGAGEILLVVGPEGGLDDAEVDTLRQAGATVARLGPTVLRTSTAGVVAASVVLAELGRWGAPDRQDGSGR
jgi:16S rRNA (uracil1498-N3)-methyltransferase